MKQWCIPCIMLRFFLKKWRQEGKLSKCFWKKRSSFCFNFWKRRFSKKMALFHQGPPWKGCIISPSRSYQVQVYIDAWLKYAIIYLNVSQLLQYPSTRPSPVATMHLEMSLKNTFKISANPCIAASSPSFSHLAALRGCTRSRRGSSVEVDSCLSVVSLNCSSIYCILHSQKKLLG